ncbi:hypothetical protein [Metabacillus sediminilitoris]|uniref:Uncharacterized protein n=1 Tax=Metabacillus sediminilitoris TaxID=2567941 RepID=A0A4S4C2U5_9BACI|nr:hypothetical protein [Metabacillus sediminilitoris]QGQ47592.1 hypothetical protein GMB29_21365 [Metabacillus sediminilitoris]THF82025.1 hypothetical protein E6W99_05100 [Metabacillus sediminilitoris]
MVFTWCVTVFYTLTFSAGGIAGTSFAQGIVTFSVRILPLLIVALIAVQLEVFTGVDFTLDDDILESTYHFTPIAYVFF